MNQNNTIKLFQDKKIRSVWDDKSEEWLFSVVDVVGALTNSVNPTDYFKKMRKREDWLDAYVGTVCPHVNMYNQNNKLRSTLAANTEVILRIIQSIPSKKAEPFKRWLAQVGKEHIDEIVDPELAINRAMRNYLRLGYDEAWINQRLKSIQIRKDLTDEWKSRGVKEGVEFAILTDEISKGWSGMTTREYKKHKNLHKENLRDNMTNLELVFSMLAEATTTELSKTKQPNDFLESQQVARDGGAATGDARRAVENRLGHSIISKENHLSPNDDKNFIGDQSVINDANGDKVLILEYVRQHGSISISEAKNLIFGISRRTLQRRLTDLVVDGKLEKHGSTNLLRYTLPEHNKKIVNNRASS